MTPRKHAVSRWRTAGLALLTMIVEKNPFKRLGLNVAFVISATRVTIMLFTAVDLHRLWVIPVIGWPDATLAIAIVLAHPLCNALERMKPDATVDVAKELVGRFGVGEVARIDTVAARRRREPSKYDDHRADRRAA